MFSSVVMATNPWGWSPYEGYYNHSAPWMASPSPYCGYSSPAPPPVYGYAPPGPFPTYGLAPAWGSRLEVGEQKLPTHGVHKVFEEMAPAVFESKSTQRNIGKDDSMMQSPDPSANVTYYGQVQGSAQKVFDDRSELQRRVLSVTLQHQKTPLPVEVIHMAFAHYGGVEKVAYSTRTPTLHVLVLQFQHRLMAVEAAEALQGDYIPGTACQLLILFARESELQTFQNEDAFQKNSDKEISKEETKWEGRSVMDIKAQQPNLGKENDATQQLGNKISNAVRKREDMFQRWEHEKLQECEQEELEQELNYFFDHAFDLFEEGYDGKPGVTNEYSKAQVPEAVEEPEVTVTELLACLQEAIYENKLSLCHLNMGRWLRHITEEQKEELLKSIEGLPLPEAMDINNKVLLVSIEEKSVIPCCYSKGAHSHYLKGNVANGELLPLAKIPEELSLSEERTVEGKIQMVCTHLGESVSQLLTNAGNDGLVMPWDLRRGNKTKWLLPLFANCNVKHLFTWDPGDARQRKNPEFLLQTVFNYAMLSYPWNPGDKTNTKLLMTYVLNVKLQQPWEPGPVTLTCTILQSWTCSEVISVDEGSKLCLSKYWASELYTA